MKIPLVCFLFLFTCIIHLSAQKTIPSKVSKTAVKGWNNFDGNNVNAAVSNAGTFGDYQKSNSSGVEWPKGSSKHSVYTSGLWVVGKHRPSDSLRTAVMQYSIEYQPGKIISTFNTSTNVSSVVDNPLDSKYHTYKITKSDALNGGNADYDQWPAGLGAPYSDKNDNGVYEKGIDNPLKWGDQMLWNVSNDANYLNHRATGVTQPMGIELQSTFFGYERQGALENTVFLRYKIINKSDADYDSVYIGYAHDTDLGNPIDDRSGVDTVLALSYIYNGDDNDEDYGYGAMPPAGGFVLLQGPIVKTNDNNDTARTEGLQKIGYKNLSIAAHTAFFNGDPQYADPPLGNKLFAQQAFNYMKGTIGTSGSKFRDPITGKETRYMFSGDPVANNGSGTGWLQSVDVDIRNMLSTGPFTLAKGDTQEIVWAYIIARDTSRLSSITKLRAHTKDVIGFFAENFPVHKLPPTPPGPKLHTENLFLEWGKRPISVSAETLSVQLMNWGNDTLLLDFGQLGDPSFSIISPSTAKISVLSGKAITIKFTFAPDRIGVIQDTITVTTNDPLYSIAKIALRGNGINITPAKAGVLYAASYFDLYSLSLSNGAAHHISLLDNSVFPTGMTVEPNTKNLITSNNTGLFRISSTNQTMIQMLSGFSVNSFFGNMFYENDSLLVFASDTTICRLNTGTLVIDTVAVIKTPARISALTKHPNSGSYYFGIRMPSFMSYNPDTGDAVYRYNPYSKTLTRVGRTKIGKFIRSLLFDNNGTLYALIDSSLSSTAKSYLITVDTNTARGTLIGSCGVGQLHGLAKDPSTVLSVKERIVLSPETYSLFQNYPNPFNPTTTINYALPKAGNVVLKVFDVLGKEVATLVNGFKESGRYAVEFDASNLSSGMYLYKITSDKFSEVKKMMFVK